MLGPTRRSRRRSRVGRDEEGTMASPGGGGLGRSWRRLRRRPVAVQVGAVIAVAVVIGGIVLAVAGKSHTTPPKASTTTTTSGVTPPERASTSSAGVSAGAISVVFPVSNLTALSASLGFQGDVEYS